MSVDVRSWLSTRTPKQVFDLAPWLGAVPAGEDVPSSLTFLGRRALGEALAAPGRVRASALHLLAADALITYACEAALEAEEPEQELGKILQEVSER